MMKVFIIISDLKSFNIMSLIIFLYTILCKFIWKWRHGRQDKRTCTRVQKVQHMFYLFKVQGKNILPELKSSTYLTFDLCPFFYKVMMNHPQFMVVVVMLLVEWVNKYQLSGETQRKRDAAVWGSHWGSK